MVEALASSRNFQIEQKGEETEFPDAALYDIGVFYLLRLEPEHDPNRFKVGSMMSIARSSAGSSGRLWTKWSRNT